MLERASTLSLLSFHEILETTVAICSFKTLNDKGQSNTGGVICNALPKTFIATFYNYFKYFLLKVQILPVMCMTFLIT